MSTKTKSVEYAYPSSTDAAKFNCGKKGCWIIDVHEKNYPKAAAGGFETKEKAVEAAQSGEFAKIPWNWMFLMYNPEFK